MTYDAERIKAGREPFEVIECDLDFCQNTYGVAPCTASGATGAECYNTRSTCQDSANYNLGTKTYRFCEPRANLPKGEDMLPCLIDIDSASAKITPGKGIGYRASIKAVLQDFPHHDRGIDPYVATRTYDPSSQGTLLGKLRARNPYYSGRAMRRLSGYISADGTLDWANFKTRYYIIDQFDGPDRQGRMRITAKDILSLADDEKAKFPAASTGTLSADLTAGATSLTLEPGKGAGYATSGRVRIGDELIAYSGKSTDTLTGLTRGVGGTTAEEHSAGDLVQQCKVYSGTNVVDIVYELLRTGVGLPEAYLPYDAGHAVPTGTNDEWDDEKALWLSSMSLTCTLSEPEGVKSLLEELTEQCGFELWWDDANHEVKLKANVPPLSTVVTLTDDYHFADDGVTVKDDEKSRLTEVWFYYGQIDRTGDDSPDNFRYMYVKGDSTKSGVDQFNGDRVKVITSRWHSSSAAVSTIAARILNRYKSTPKKATFTLDIKDNVELGDVAYMDTRAIQGVDGANLLYQVQIVQRDEMDGSKVKCEAVTGMWSAGRYGLICPDSMTDYTSASIAQRERYVWMSFDTGYFSDGSEAQRLV